MTREELHGAIVDILCTGWDGSDGARVGPEGRADEIIKMLDKEAIVIPMPKVAPLGVPVNKAEYVQEVWDAFVKPDQDTGLPQSVEMRVLMAILRAVHKGLEDVNSPPADQTEKP